MHPYAKLCCARKNQKKWKIFKKCPLVFDAKCNQKNVTPEFEDFKFINFNVFFLIKLSTWFFLEKSTFYRDRIIQNMPIHCRLF